jgi:hypothetical protein
MRWWFGCDGAKDHGPECRRLGRFVTQKSKHSTVLANVIAAQALLTRTAAKKNASTRCEALKVVRVGVGEDYCVLIREPVLIVACPVKKLQPAALMTVPCNTCSSRSGDAL